MTETNTQGLMQEEAFHFGHLKAVLLMAIILVAISWMKDPQLFDVFKHKAPPAAASANVPHYYAYVPPAEDMQPQVLGASTQPQGPVIINDDGSITPVDLGQVLGASTQGVELSLDQVSVKSIPDSSAAIKKYFSDARTIESGAIDQVAFVSALNSNDQKLINEQAQKLDAVVSALQKLPVPQSLVKLQKLKVIQYNSAIALLRNYTQADQNPETVIQNLQQFMKSQVDLDAENAAMAQKFPDEDPLAAIYASPDTGSVAGAYDITADSQFSAPQDPNLNQNSNIDYAAQ